MSKVLLAFAIALSATSAFAQTHTLREGDQVDGVVAVVGKHPILKSNIDAQLQLMLVQSGRNGSVTPDSVAIIRKQILQSEIDQKVLLVKAEQDSNISVSETEIDEQLGERIKTYERQFGSRAEMEKAFGKSVADIQASPELRERAREQIYIEKLRGSRFSKPPVVSRRDVQEFYLAYKDSLPSVGEQVELATLVKLIKAKPGEDVRIKALAKKLVDSLRNGSNFSDFAKRYSIHSTGANGGDLGGPYPRGTFIADFEAAAFKLKIGEISDPVETDQGTHIIKLLERKGEEIRVAQILLKASASGEDDDNARRMILQVRDSILNGADFNRMARLHSDDQETRENGGYLGKINLSELGPEQRGVIDSMKTDEVSRPMKISFSKTVTGYQIVKLLRRITSHKPTVESDYRELEYAATQWKQLKTFQKFVADARKEVYVEIR